MPEPLSSRQTTQSVPSGAVAMPAGLDGSLIQATPPLTISDAELDEAFALLGP